MLPACVLYHVEVEGAVFDPVAELEDFELVLRRFVLLLGQVRVHVFHVLGGVLIAHLLRQVVVVLLQVGHHLVDHGHLIELDLWVDSAHCRQLLQGVDLALEHVDALFEVHATERLGHVLEHAARPLAIHRPLFRLDWHRPLLVVTHLASGKARKLAFLCWHRC